MTPATFFRENGFFIARSFLAEPLLSTSLIYTIKRSSSELSRSNDQLFDDTPSFYGDTLMESILDGITPTLESALEMKLHPTFAYFRVYKEGDVLVPHKDRDACEIAMTLNLGGGSTPWPIYIEAADEEEVYEVALEPGDAAIYRGREMRHWRHELADPRQSQVFLFFVDQNGPHAEWKHDKRDQYMAVA